jgi:hypothetical protein
MVDSTVPMDRNADSVCPWCSAAVTPETAICPSCAAILISDEEHELPGITAVDPAVVRGEKKAPGRSRLLSWISGEYTEDAPEVGADAQALAPPDPAVQREILRLQLEAELTNLQAEADAIRSEAAFEGRDLPAELAPAEAAAHAAEPAVTPTPTAEGEGTEATPPV